MSFALVLIVSAFVGIVTLGSRTAAAAGTPQFRSLHIGTQAWQVTTFNPMAITLVDEYIVVYTVYSTLLTHDKSYHIQGDLAYAWNLAPDNLTWTFNLAHGAYFTDPTNPTSTAHPVTASDVVFAYELQMNQTASILHSYTLDIQSITAVDTYTVEIVTKRPVATMESTAANIPILPQYVWLGIKNPVQYNPPYPIGSGGYYYDTANATTGLAIFRRSPHYYWSTYYCEVMKPNEIRYISYADPGTMVTDFQSGASQLNAIVGIDPSTYTTTLKDWSPKWAVDQGFVGEYSINAMTNAERAWLVSQGFSQFSKGNPTNNQILAGNWTVRRAIAMSINKTGLIKDALLGLGNVGDSLVPDTNPWHYSPPAQYLYHFNPGAARTILYAAGWRWDASGNPATNATFPLYQKGSSNGTVYWPLSFRFYTLNTEDWWKLAATDIVGWLNQAGIQTTDRLGNIGFGAYSINQMSGYWLSADYDMWLWDWVFTPASDPSTDILEVETTTAIGPTSDNFYSNATFDALYNQSVTTVDPVARRAILNEMQMMIYNYSSYIIPFYKDDLYAATTASPGGGQAWENWGNWTAQNGLTPDSDLMNLWAQVDPADNPAPAIASFPAFTWVNGTAASIGISVNDPEAAYLNYSFDFGDGSPLYNTTTVPVSHTYTLPGNYTIKVRVTNSEFPACGSTTATIVKAGSVNLPPTPPVIQGSSYPTWYVNQAYNVTATSSDPETTDTLNFTWTWGDGSQTYCPADQTVTNCVTSGGTSTASHAFSQVTTSSPYTVTVSVSDGHTAVATQNPIYVNVTTPPATHGWLAGVVKDSSTGNPIAGAVVTTTPGNAASSATPAAGTYNITLAPGVYNATAVAQFYLDSTPQQVTISADKTTALDIALVLNLGWITGTVTSNSTHAPIASAAVYVTLTGSPTPLKSTATDAQGKYNVSVEPDTYIVNASANAFLAASHPGVIVTSGHATDVPFALDPFNLPPQILTYAPNELTTYPNTTLWFNMSAKDYEGDPLLVSWTFGDGSTATNYSASGTATGIALSQTHKYATVGTYKATLTVTDNKTSPGLNHHPQANVTVNVITPSSAPGGTTAQGNPWINYGIPIAIVAAIVAAVVVVLWRRRKAAEKEEAETGEEPQQGPPTPPPP